jgi:hypothetical protein
MKSVRIGLVVLASVLAAEAQTWKLIETKGGRQIRRPSLSRVTDTGIWVIDGHSKEQVFLDGTQMPDWLVAEVKPLVMEERRKMAERVAAAERGEYQGPAEKNQLPWGDGSGQLKVGGKVYQVTALIEETPIGLKVLHSGGVVFAPFAEMDEETREAFGFEEGLAKRWTTLDDKAKAVESAAWFERRRAKKAAAKGEEVKSGAKQGAGNPG